jgi:hypothetical protein
VSWQCGHSLATSQLLLVKTEPADTIACIAEKKTPAADTIVYAAEGVVLKTQGGRTVIYHVRMTDLAEGEYRYSVCTDNKQSEWNGFTISANDTFRFVYVGDIQDTIGSTTQNLFAAVSRMSKDAPFWVLGGDVIERPHDAYWNEYFTSMDTLARTVPVIACPGNHEYIKGFFGKLDERFVHHFSYLADSRSDGHAVFEMHYGPVALITLDSNRDMWTLFSQRRWLEKALQRAEGAQWKIVVMHHPVFSVRGKYRHFFIRRLFVPLFHKYGVDMVLQGHEHCYARKITKDKNQDITTPVYLISQFSPKDYRFNKHHNYDRIGNGMRFYQIINVSSDTLSLKTYTENEELYDHVRIVKTGDERQVTDMAVGIPEHIDRRSPRIRK